jgi:hypothetical protein
MHYLSLSNAGLIRNFYRGIKKIFNLEMEEGVDKIDEIPFRNAA